MPKRNSYSKLFSNPYGRSYRRPKKFKTLLSHVAQDSIDTMLYNTFDNQQLKETKRKKKADEKAKNMLHNFQIKFLEEKIDFNKIAGKELSINISKDELAEQITHIVESYINVTKIRLELEKQAIHINNMIQNISLEELATHSASKSPITIVTLVVFFLILVFNFSISLLLGGFIGFIILFAVLKNHYKSDYKEKLNNKRKNLKEIESLVEDSNLYLNFNLTHSEEVRYNQLISSFNQICHNNRTWDVLTFSSSFEKPEDYKRVEINFSNRDPANLISNYKIPNLVNYDGDDLFLYPYFILSFDEKEIGIIDYRDVEISSKTIEIAEDEKSLTQESNIVGEKWKWENKNGSPNKRFKNNKILSIVEYLRMDFQSTNIDETYLFSSIEKSQHFVKLLKAYEISS